MRLLFGSKKEKIYNEILDEHEQSLTEKCDNFNQNFKLGELIRYWYYNDKNYNSTFAFITHNAVYIQSSANSHKIWFRAISIPFYSKKDNYTDNIIEITESFHCEKATKDDFIEYKQNILERLIKNDKYNIKLLKENIRMQVKERNDLIINLEHNLFTIKNLISNGGNE